PPLPYSPPAFHAPHTPSPIPAAEHCDCLSARVYFNLDPLMYTRSHGKVDVDSQDKPGDQPTIAAINRTSVQRTGILKPVSVKNSVAFSLSDIPKRVNRDITVSAAESRAGDLAISPLKPSPRKNTVSESDRTKAR